MQIHTPRDGDKLRNIFNKSLIDILTKVDEKILEVLACPKCKGKLLLQEDKLICRKCMLRYRIEDGIPIMLTDEAEGI